MNPIDLGELPEGAVVSNYLYSDLDAEERHQDLLTVALPTGYNIDVGWFPEYEPKGEYWIRASSPTGEIEPIKTRSLGVVQATVTALIAYYSGGNVSAKASTSRRAPDVCLN
jgi:hypothetical protein